MTLRSSRLLRRMLRRALGGTVLSRPISTGIGGGRLWFDAGQQLGLVFRRTAAEEEDVARTLLRLSRPGDLVFDIGANIGFHTVVLGRAHRGSRVVAVEPGAEARAMLRLNARRNGVTQLAIEERPLSDAVAEREFHEDLATGRTSSLEATAWHPDGDGAVQQRRVVTTTLDALVAEYGRPTIVKCDVEGHELCVLAGGQELLTAGALWVVEVTHATRAAVHARFASAGYACFDARQPDAGSAAACNATHLLAVPGDLRHRLVEDARDAAAALPRTPRDAAP